MITLVAAVVLSGCGGAPLRTVATGKTSSTSFRVTPSTTATSAPTTTAPAITGTVAAETTTTVRAAPTTTASHAVCASTVVGQMASTGGGAQLITVVAASTGSTTATVMLWQRTGTCWSRAAGPWTGWVGSNGVSADKVEGDGKTPIGVFAIGSTFYGTDPDPGVHGSYHQLVCGDWWDEDPESPQYNTFQHVACDITPSFALPPDGSGSEPLWTETTAYQSFAFIEYNTDPVIPGKGSAIFLHDDIGGPTDGCVSLPPSDLDTALRWLEPGRSPHIAIGTTSDIRQL